MSTGYLKKPVIFLRKNPYMFISTLSNRNLTPVLKIFLFFITADMDRETLLCPFSVLFSCHAMLGCISS